MLALHASFRMGCRWPFRFGDVLEVWRGEELVTEISGELLTSLVTHYLVGHDLVRRFDSASTRGGAPPTRILPMVKAVRDRAYRAELRARRRARKPGGE